MLVRLHIYSWVLVLVVEKCTMVKIDTFLMLV